MDDLAVEIALLDNVAVDDGDAPDASASEIEQRRAADASRAHHTNRGLGER